MKRVLVVTIVLLLAAPAAVADELQLGWRTLTEYDSEVTSQDGGEDDLIFTNGPVTRVSGERRRFSYEIEHFSGYEKYVWLNELDDWRHELSARLGLELSSRVRLTVSNSFRQFPQLRTFQDLDDVIDDEPNLNLDTGTFTTNVFTTTLTTIPLPRLVTTSQLSVVFQDVDNPTLTSQNTLSTTLLNELSYRWNESHSFGGGMRFSSRDFETGDLDTVEVDDTIDATTQTYEAFGRWVWQVDARTTFSTRFGPAFSTDDVDDPETRTEAPTFPFTVLLSDGVERGFLRDATSCPAENARPALGGVILTGDCLLFNQPFGTGTSGLAGEELGIIGPQLDGLRALTTLLSRPDSSSGGDDGANLFVSLTLTHEFDRMNVSASWVRSDSQTQGLGSNTIVDTLLLSSQYRFSRRLRLNADFRFTRRFSDVEREQVLLVLSETAQNIPEASLPGFLPVQGFPVLGLSVEDASFEQTFDSYSLRFRLVRDWNRYSTAFVSLSLRRQENEVDSQLDFQDVDSSQDTFLIQLGFTYRFQPIRF